MTRITADITFAGERLQRPPLRTLRMTVLVSSTWTAPLWVLVPDRTGGLPVAGAVGRVEFHVVGGATVVALRATDHGAFAVLLDGGGAVTLRDLPVAHWGERPAQLVLELVSCTALLVDGAAVDSTPAAGELDASLLAGRDAVVRELGGVG